MTSIWFQFSTWHSPHSRTLKWTFSIIVASEWAMRCHRINPPSTFQNERFFFTFDRNCVDLYCCFAVLHRWTIVQQTARLDCFTFRGDRCFCFVLFSLFLLEELEQTESSQLICFESCLALKYHTQPIVNHRFELNPILLIQQMLIALNKITSSQKLDATHNQTEKHQIHDEYPESNNQLTSLNKL